jgi:hypothetical protein
MRTGLGQVQGTTICECKNKRIWKAIEVFPFFKKVDYVLLQCSVDHLVFDGLYVVVCRRGQPFPCKCCKFSLLVTCHFGIMGASTTHIQVVFQLMNIKGHRSRYYAQHTKGSELCTTSVNIQMSTVIDGRNFRMDRVRIVCTDNGGDLFMGDFEWMEETN